MWWSTCGFKFFESGGECAVTNIKKAEEYVQLQILWSSGAFTVCEASPRCFLAKHKKRGGSFQCPACIAIVPA